MKKTRTLIAVIMACLPLASQAQSAVPCWTMEGQPFELTFDGSSLKLPDSVAAIDLCSVGAVTLDCSSASPNCLFYTNGTSRVEGLPSANVVCDGVCDGLLLTDAAGFYCPVAFTATDAMLRFTPRWDEGADEADFSQPCHETVLLPFEAYAVAPADVNGTMPAGWLQTACFHGSENNMLQFATTETEVLYANTPYLVRFAYAAHGRQIHFFGQNQTIQPTMPALVGEEGFWFTGSTMSAYEQAGYFRYHRGQEPCFIHTGDGRPMEPFRSFIVSAEPDVTSDETAHEGGVLRYVVSDHQTTGTDVHRHHTTARRCYDLQGKPWVSGKGHKGVCLTGGVKVIR